MSEDNGSRIGRRQFIEGVAGAAGASALVGGASASQSQQLQRLGFTSYVRGGSWITAYVEATRFYCQDRGIQLEVRPNRQSAAKQVTDIRDFANKGFDAIIAGIWSTGAAVNAIEYAMQQGVPVMATNADTASPDIPLYVGFSNTQGGRKSAVQMVEALEEQKPDQDEWRVLNVRGVQGNQSAEQRSQGFLDYMNQQDKVVVEQTINGEYAQDVAQNKVQQYVNANGAPDGIYSGNLSMGLGVVGALRNLNLIAPRGQDDHIVLTQMDGSPQVNPLVNEGVIDAAVDQPNYFYNPIAIKYMIDYVEAGGVDGGGQSAIPEVGTTVLPEGGTSTDTPSATETGTATAEGPVERLNVETGQHKGVDMWSEPIWSPGKVREQNGHPWFRTDSIVIDQDNATQPFLWGNIWGQ